MAVIPTGLRSQTGLFLGLVLLIEGVVVAYAFTPRPHSGGDNAGYVALAVSLAERGTFQELWDPAEPPHTKYPPVFPALLAIALVLGAQGWTVLKLIPALSSVLAVGLAFLWARRRAGSAMAAAAALLFGLSSALVYYSHWVLSDPTFVAFTMAALWALEPAGPEDPEEPRRRPGAVWMAAGFASVLLAYFTRSAGLPLVAAALLWLLTARRWRAALALALAFAVPALLWWLRGRGVGGGAYVSEFWLIDPYRPELGTMGPADLLARVRENFEAYVIRIVPGGLVGEARPMVLPLLGVGLLATALVGWVRALRTRLGVAEIFAPAYFALLLLWPAVWSGDRFALPLYPLLLLYAASALDWMLTPLRSGLRRGVLLLLLALVAWPALTAWSGMAREARNCRAATRSGTPEACLPSPFRQYQALARWSGDNLPEDAAVVTRKPRIFYVQSGVKTRSIPLLSDPASLLETLRQGGSRYFTVDALDNLSRLYLFPLLREFPDSLCRVVEVVREGRVETALLAVLNPGEGAVPEARPEPSLPRCPETLVRSGPRGRPDPTGWQIPLLLWGSE